MTQKQGCCPGRQGERRADFPTGREALNALTVRRGDGNGEYGALAFVVFDPANDVLVHERPHLGWPSFDARVSAFAFLQGEDELGALAVGDIEHARFPRVQRGDGGRACERFVRSGCPPAGGGFDAMYAALGCVRWRSLLGFFRQWRSATDWRRRHDVQNIQKNDF
jgi:hypothetical protein